jgi:hypothetical protein
MKSSLVNLQQQFVSFRVTNPKPIAICTQLLKHLRCQTFTNAQVLVDAIEISNLDRRPISERVLSLSNRTCRLSMYRQRDSAYRQKNSTHDICSPHREPRTRLCTQHVHSAISTLETAVYDDGGVHIGGSPESEGVYSTIDHRANHRRQRSSCSPPGFFETEAR